MDFLGGREGMMMQKQMHEGIWPPMDGRARGKGRELHERKQDG